jgi:hypothetical protein
MELSEMFEVDLFNYIEQLFTEVVYFLYNLFYSATLLLIQPIRGAARLAARLSSATQKQVGPNTLLFVMFFLLSLFMFVRGSLSMIPGSDIAFQSGFSIQYFATSMKENRSAELLVPTLISALAISVFVDFSQQVIIGITYRHANAKKRQIILRRVKYTLCFPMIWFLLFLISSPWWFEPAASRFLELFHVELY